MQAPRVPPCVRAYAEARYSSASYGRHGREKDVRSFSSPQKSVYDSAAPLAAAP